MTFQQFQKSWWSWLLCMAIAVAIGFSRGWDTFSLVFVGVLVFTGVIRAFMSPLRGFAHKQMAGHLAKLPAEQRERELQRLTPEQRLEVEKELRGHIS